MATVSRPLRLPLDFDPARLAADLAALKPTGPPIS